MTDKQKVIWQALDNELSLWKNLPRKQGQLETIADMLDEYTTSVEDVDKLVTELLEEYDDWPGPKTLRDTYIRLFQPFRVVMGDPESK